MKTTKKSGVKVRTNVQAGIGRNHNGVKVKSKVRAGALNAY
jgi:hypothetical protein